MFNFFKNTTKEKLTNCKKCHWYSEYESPWAPWGEYSGEIYKSCIKTGQSLNSSRPLYCDKWEKKR